MLKVAKETGGGIDAFLGQNTSFNGTLVFEGIVRLDGNFEGNVKSNDTLVIAESGNVNAQIESGIVKISGTFDDCIKLIIRIIFNIYNSAFFRWLNIYF